MVVRLAYSLIYPIVKITETNNRQNNMNNRNDYQTFQVANKAEMAKKQNTKELMNERKPLKIVTEYANVKDSSTWKLI